MNKEKLYELVKKYLIEKYGDYDVLGDDPEEIIEFMVLAEDRVEYQNKFESFFHWLYYIGLREIEEWLWLFNEMNKIR